MAWNMSTEIILYKHVGQEKEGFLNLTSETRKVTLAQTQHGETHKGLLFMSQKLKIFLA